MQVSWANTAKLLIVSFAEIIIHTARTVYSVLLDTFKTTSEGRDLDKLVMWTQL